MMRRRARRSSSSGWGPQGVVVTAAGPDTETSSGSRSAAAASRYPEDLRGLVEQFLAELHFSTESSTRGLDEAMRYSLLAGGKRVRPVLTLATARALNADPLELLPIAGAIELVHTYSLIHDDLPAMDDDDLRRGRPTCHIAFGENVAILAGDGLFAEAYRLVLDRQPGEPERVLSALRELSQAISVEGMVGGQYIDVATADDLTHEELRHMHELKTGRLIRASVTVAPLILGAPPHITAGLRRFADELGVLFQIVDDILDVTGDREAMGKPSGADERLGKRTYVSLHGLERARELAGESHSSTKAILTDPERSLEGDVSALEQITDYIYVRES
jgi:geranylgeranyl diphosphate synthase type II